MIFLSQQLLELTIKDFINLLKVHRNMSVEEVVNIGKQLAETCKE